MTQPRVLVVCPIPERAARRAREEFDAVLSQDRVMTVREAAEVLNKTPSIEGVLFSTYFAMSAEAIAALPGRIKIAATCSVGFDHVDLAAAAKRGLIITNTPEVLTDATADMTLLVMLAACRRAREYLEVMTAGWGRSFQLNDMLGTDFSGKTLGIYGFGRIGQAVAKRARGFGVQILYHDVHRLQPELEQGAQYFETFHAMLPHCQILSLHALGGSTTSGILDRKAISLLPKGAIVVNTARGTLVDEDALIEGLRSGHIGAAGLDVFRNEPHYDLRLRDLPNVFITPHMASATVETREAMGARALDNLAAVLSGRAALNPVAA